MATFYICHPDDKKSCGACCGLYNYEGFDRETISAALQFRTDLFHAMKPRGQELDEFRAVVCRMDLRPKLLEEIYCCEFLGFVDAARRKVGCLVHPALHGRWDGRDRAYYGAETCALHKCGSYGYLTEPEARPVIAALDDWYLYGQCITDIDLLKEFYREVSDIRCATIRPEIIAERGELLDIFREYLLLKETWPFRQGGRRFGQYIFENGSYQVAETPWKTFGMTRPREWRILRSLGSEFKDVGETEAAVKIISDLVSEMAAAI